MLGSTLASPDDFVRGHGGAPARRGGRAAAAIRRWRASARPSASPPAGASLNRGQLTIGLKPLRERGICRRRQVIARLRPKLAAGGRHADLPVVGAGSARRRAGRRRATSSCCSRRISASCGDWAQKLEDEAAHGAGPADVSSDQDRAGPAGERGDRPRRRGPARRLRRRDRRRAEQRLRAAADLHHLHRRATSTRSCWRSIRRCRPIPRCSTASIVGAAGGQQVPLRQRGAVRARHGAAGGAAPGPVPGGDASASTWRPAWRWATRWPRVQRRRPRRCACPRRCAPSSPATRAGCRNRWTRSRALIGAAFLAIYIVLGVLYESLTQPLTIISTLPSAGLGALLALLVTGTELVDHGHHRHRAADGHREEERHHAGGFRAGGRSGSTGRRRSRRSTRRAWSGSGRSS